MKTINLVLKLLLISSILCGCTTQKEVQTAKGKKHKVIIPETTENASAQLTKPGQQIRQKGWGTLTLLKEIPVNKEYIMSNMVLKIKNVRLIKLSHISKSAKETLYNYTGKSVYVLFEEDQKGRSREQLEDRANLTRTEIGDATNYVDIDYTIENRNKKEINFFSMEEIFLNKIKIHYYVPEQNFISSDDTLVGTSSESRTSYQPGEVRKGEIGLLLPEETKSISSLTFKTDDVTDGESNQLISAKKSFTISLK